MASEVATLVDGVWQVPVVEATPENFSGYGTLVSGKECSAPGLTIPFYSHVEEGKNLPFIHTGKCVVRTARIHPSPSNRVNWIERHVGMTQVRGCAKRLCRKPR